MAGGGGGVGGGGSPVKGKAGAHPPRKVVMMGRAMAVVRKGDSFRALDGPEGQAIDSAAVEKYLTKSFGVHLDAVKEAMEEAARSHSDDEALNAQAFGM